MLYGPSQTLSSDVNGTITIPGVGRCQSNAALNLIVGCAIAIYSPWSMQGQWATGEPSDKSPTVLSVKEVRSPIPLEPSLTPLQLAYGGFGAATDYSGGRIYLKLRKPMAYVHRPIELNGVLLD